MDEDLSRALDLIPDHVNRTTVGEWAEQNRILPQGLTSMPGPFRWGVAPYMREIADCFSESSDVREVAVMKAAQVTYTVGALENAIGYMIACAPGPAMFISADKGVAETSVELRLDRMLESTGLARLVFSQSDKRHNKKTGDTKAKKEYPGGFLLAVGPNVGAKLRSFSVRYEFFDEIDAYPQEIGTSDKSKGKTAAEGDPIALAKKRTAAFEAIRKIIYGSTPLDDATSRIKPLFLRGDQRRYFVPCPHCGHMQTLRWRDPDGTFRLKFETDDAGRLIQESVHYECEKCGGAWKNSDKAVFLPAGEWRATAKALEQGFRSYHISALYSPLGMQTWEAICQEWIDAQGDLTKLRTFVNTVLGETWVEKGEAPHPEKVWARREGYEVGTAPTTARPLVCTVGADVQKDRIECEVVAWGRDAESWSIEYLTLPGDTSDVNGDAWKAMASVIETTHAGLPVALAMIDSGYNSPVVYSFCDRYLQGVFPIKGDPDLARDKATRRVYALRDVSGYKTRRADLDTTHLKLEVYNHLKRGTATGDVPTEPFPGYCHFPHGYTRGYYDGLMSEDRLPQRMANGKTVMKWVQHGRNEPLDARAYALAALYVMFGESLRVLQEEAEDDDEVRYGWSDFWDEMEARRGA
jgi:phage terminase large subunit GpA-like protein